jgi:small subunit ribosomal protein S5
MSKEAKVVEEKTVKETPKTKKVVEAVVETPETQLKEMEAIVEEKEKKVEEEQTKVFIEATKHQDVDLSTLSREDARTERFAREEREKLERWVPKTQLGKEVLSGKIKDIDEVLTKGRKILEPQIVDILLPHLTKDVLFIGQSKGKFGGGKRRAFRQTQKISKEGSSLTFGVMSVVGDGNGHIGVGYGRASETLPAREKAVRKAKLNILTIPRGCGSYDCSCSETHSIPMEVTGKSSSVVVKLIPAPQGTGLAINNELKKIMKAVGIKDIYSQSFGKVRTTFNTVKACMEALNKLNNFDF